MKKIVSRILLLCFGIGLPGVGLQLVQAQKYTIQGTVTDSAGAPLEVATVMLMKQVDTSLVAYAITKKDGIFKLSNVENDKYILRITFIGLQEYEKWMDLATYSTAQISLGTIAMEKQAFKLDGVTVTGERNPVTVRGDTVEFNAASFKTQTNATVEDLLKKLPGVEVDDDGKVNAQGEEVTRVFVDGKRFFGDDPKMATRNLPAEAVEKVQVYDSRSDLAEFSGIEDGEREKTINITLKANRRKGYFGNVSAGYGDQDRYDGGANINKFNKEQQISLLANLNNVNRQGFSTGDFNSFRGSMSSVGGGGFSASGGSRGGGGSNVTVRTVTSTSSGNGGGFGGSSLANGFMTNLAGGLNYNDLWGKKTEIQSSYFYNYINQTTDSQTKTQNFLDTGDFVDTRVKDEDNENGNHRLNLQLTHEIDSAQAIRFMGNFSTNTTTNTNVSTAQSFTDENVQQNSSTSDRLTTNTVFRAGGDLMYRYNFAKKGRNASMSVNWSQNDNERNMDLYSEQSFLLRNSGLYRQDTINQDQITDVGNTTYGLKVYYTEPLTKTTFLEAHYTYENDLRLSDRDVFDLKNGLQIINPNLTLEYASDFNFHQGGLSYRVNGRNTFLSVGLDVQNSFLDGRFIDRDTFVTNTSTKLLPSMRFNWKLSSFQNVGADYRVRVRQPSIDQLKPVADNTNPLNIRIGNTQLKPEEVHNVSARFFSFNPAKFAGMFSSLSFTYTKDKIGNAQTIDENLVRTTMPINTPDEYALSGYISQNSRISSIASRYSVGANASYAKGYIRLNGTLSPSFSNTIGGNLRWTTNFFKEKLEVTAETRLTYNTLRYESESPVTENYYQQSYTGRMELELPWKMEVNSSFRFNVYNNTSIGTTQTIPLWNASIQKNLLAADRGTLEFSVTDILNRNIGFDQSAGANYIYEETTQSLARYFMLKFTYRINKLDMTGGKGRGPGGGMRMIITE